jgi:hypothetical protein
MGFYVNLDGVQDGQLLLAGYVLVDENEQFRVYRHFGEDIIVDKSDPFIVVDDINDAAILGSDIVPMPPKD